MNKSLLVAGGLVIAGGALAYYYLKQNGGVSCGNFLNQTECEDAGCYWWSNGTCHSYSEGDDPCAVLNAGYGCYPNVTGWRNCDFPSNNLCECDGSEYNLIDEGSIICRDDIKYAKCGIDRDGYSHCLKWYYDYGDDECDPSNYGFGQGCSCSATPCLPQCYCEPRDGQCCVKPMYTQGQGYMEKFEPFEQCTQLRGGIFNTVYGNRCYFTVPNGPWAAQRMMNVSVSWKWGCPWWGGGCGYWFNIYGVYHNSQTGQDEMQELAHMVGFGTENGTHSEAGPFNFAPQGFHEICVETRLVSPAGVDVNVKPTAFYASFSF